MSNRARKRGLMPLLANTTVLNLVCLELTRASSAGRTPSVFGDSENYLMSAIRLAMASIVRTG